MANLTGPQMGFPFGSDERSTTQQLPLGAFGYDKDGNKYRYVKAGATIAAKDAVRFNGSALGYDDVRPVSAAQQFVLGVATAAFASGEYGFILEVGVVSAKVVNSTAVGSLLVTGAVAGTLELADATDFAGRVSVALTTAGDSATNGAIVRVGG